MPRVERVRRLEEQVPAVEDSLARALPRGEGKPSLAIGQGTLLSRVEALEHAMGILMETQETLIMTRRGSAPASKQGCCTIM